MLQFFYEFFPVLLFFIVFKYYDIYAATLVGMIATFLQVSIHRLWRKTWDKKQLITLVIFLSFGSMTLYFHNPIFVKWKPTVIFWIFALLIFASQFVGPKPLMQRFLQGVLEEKGQTVSFVIWKRLNNLWGIFFASLGTINLYVAYSFSNDAWVNFKFYGITGLIFLFSLLQAIYLARYVAK